MEKKYELTTETKELNGHILHRIKALMDMPLYNVKKGDLGGWIESEANLSQEGNCWVVDAMVYGNACVYGDAYVYGDAWVSGRAYITGDAVIKSNDDFIRIDNIGSRLGTTTAFRTQDNIIRIKCGCFYGTIDEFKNAVMETHKDNDKYRKEYLSFIEIIKAHFDIV